MITKNEIKEHLYSSSMRKEKTLKLKLHHNKKKHF